MARRGRWTLTSAAPNGSEVPYPIYLRGVYFARLTQWRRHVAVATANSISSNRQWLAMEEAATTPRGCGQRLWAPAGSLVFTAGACRISARPWSASAGATSRKPVRFPTISVRAAGPMFEPTTFRSAHQSMPLMTSGPCSTRPSPTWCTFAVRTDCTRHMPWKRSSGDPRHHRKADGHRGGRGAGPGRRRKGRRRPRPSV